MLTEEQKRILVAAHECRLKNNEHGRYTIDGEERPERKAREAVQGRGLIKLRGEWGKRYWFPTTAGYMALHEAGWAPPLISDSEEKT